MSLKVVHVVFVIAATVLSFGLGGLMLLGPAASRETGYGLFWVVAGAALLFYGVRVVRKLRRLGPA